MDKVRRVVTNPKMFWLPWAAAGIAWQANALHSHNGGTGSETTRFVCQTHKPAGKLVFLTIFYAGSAAFIKWYPGHIVNTINKGVSIISGPIKDNDNGTNTN